MVFGTDVKDAVLKAGIKTIPVSECGICNFPTSYKVQGDNLFFDGACDCVSYQDPRWVDWSDAADWINMQSTDKGKSEIAARFGLVHP